jgi:glycosyltransferase involved in cell wall biosynthesis
LRTAILGTVGVPANYGGFETLSENLAKYHHAYALKDGVTVYCSSRSYPEKAHTYLSAQLKYIPLHANGPQSIPYDIWSLFSAIWNRNDVILLLGVSGAIALPLIRLISSARIVTNIDGIEWRREKWQGLAKRFLRLSEKFAVRFSHELIADNDAIASYVRDAYGADCHVIAYGGDHAVAVDALAVNECNLPEIFAFSVCRIEPENNVHLILDAFSSQANLPLVVVGNWENSEYGRALRNRYTSVKHLYLLDPIYELGKLKSLRQKMKFYVHGHSAGGTNPSLVEAMHFGRPILAFDCSYNRSTTEDRALYFKSSEELKSLISAMSAPVSAATGQKMAEIAARRYKWNDIARQYFALLIR